MPYRDMRDRIPLKHSSENPEILVCGICRKEPKRLDDESLLCEECKSSWSAKYVARWDKVKRNKGTTDKKDKK